ncbi:MAG: hypothetical protein QOG81_2015, partial [Gaiellaceae bacterium]|nr:hypothetical protein [Gaiellaceae bacterium]
RWSAGCTRVPSIPDMSVILDEGPRLFGAGAPGT